MDLQIVAQIQSYDHISLPEDFHVQIQGFLPQNYSADQQAFLSGSEEERKVRGQGKWEDWLGGLCKWKQKRVQRLNLNTSLQKEIPLRFSSAGLVPSALPVRPTSAQCIPYLYLRVLHGQEMSEETNVNRENIGQTKVKVPKNLIKQNIHRQLSIKTWH